MCSFILQHMLFKTNNIYLPLMPQRVKLVVYFIVYYSNLEYKSPFKKKRSVMEIRITCYTKCENTHTTHEERSTVRTSGAVNVSSSL